MSSRTSWCCLFFISFPLIADTRSIWSEIELEDLELQKVKIKPFSKNKPIPVECYQEIPLDGLDHIFKMNFAHSDPRFKVYSNRDNNKPEACFIVFPTPVQIKYREVNFHGNKTFTYIITGNDRSRPALKSGRITNNAEKPKEPLDVICAYAYLMVLNPSISDTLTFTLSRFEDDYALYDMDHSLCDAGVSYF